HGISPPIRGFCPPQTTQITKFHVLYPPFFFIRRFLFLYYALKVPHVQSEKARNSLEKLRQNLCLTRPIFRGKLSLYFLHRVTSRISPAPILSEKRKKHENRNQMPP
ncbi:MAG: hypothetical protein K2O71_04285, partial [Lachnospiraceae bacterium]|nr:hypothetical protein [Lachnospiraceae bacterium]